MVHGTPPRRPRRPRLQVYGIASDRQRQGSSSVTLDVSQSADGRTDGPGACTGPTDGLLT